MKYLTRKLGDREWGIIDDGSDGGTEEITRQALALTERVEALVPDVGDVVYMEWVMFFGTSVPPQAILDAGEQSGDLVISVSRCARESVGSGGIKVSFSTKAEAQQEIAQRRMSMS